MLWRHGDVLVATVEQIPEGAEQQKTAVLVLGEITGHSHRVEEPQKARVWKYRGQLYLEVKSETRIVHEEHKPIVLPIGVYRIWQQREYTPERIVRVKD